MACERFATQLSDHAIGAPLGSAASAHLAICERCQQTLAREVELHTLIGGALAEVGSAKPSGNFVVSVRRTAPATGTPRWRVRWAVASALATAATLALAFYVWQPRPAMGPGPTGSAVVVDIALGPAEPLVESHAVGSQTKQPPEALRVTEQLPSASRRQRPIVLPDRFIVLVPKTEVLAVARLVRSVGQTDPSVAQQMFAAPSLVIADGPPSSRDALVVDAIDISPLPLPEPIFSK